MLSKLYKTIHSELIINISILDSSWVPVYFAVGLKVTNIRSPSILFIKSELHFGRFTTLRNSLIFDIQVHAFFFIRNQ